MTSFCCFIFLLFSFLFLSSLIKTLFVCFIIGFYSYFFNRQANLSMSLQRFTSNVLLQQADQILDWVLYILLCNLIFLYCFYQGGQIIDIRAMINDATKMNAEEGVDASVSYSVVCVTSPLVTASHCASRLFFVYLFVFTEHQILFYILFEC